MTGEAAIRYEVCAVAPSTHRADVRLTVLGTGGRPFDLVVPSWVPGSYWIQDRVRNVSDVRGVVPGTEDPAPIERLEKARWRVDPRGRDAAEVRYSVYGNELRSALFDLTAEHMFVAAGFFLPYVEGRREEPHDLALVVPDGWTVHTELAQVGTDPPTFRASDYDELVDSPVDCGRPETHTISPGGVPHRIVLCGSGGNHDPVRLQSDIGAIVEAAVRLFGDSPLPSYTFFYHLIPQPNQGLEHARSNACVVAPTVFRPEVSYRSFLALTSHEYLHLYLVKRIRPKVFDRVDYTREVYTRLLWAMEGTTDYLSHLVLLRAGLLSPEVYLRDTAESIRMYRTLPGRLHQSLEEASLAAWVDFYHRYEESPNRSISYYVKGDLVSLCLDLELRSRTGGARSLETVYRELWRSHGKPMRGIGEDELEGLVASASGVDVRSFFDDYVRGTKEVDFERYLRRAGLTLAPKSIPRRPDEGPEAGYLGVEFEDSGGFARLTVVRDGSPAGVAGLSPGDEVVAVDGGKVRFRDVANVLERYPAGARMEVTVFRRGRLATVPVVAGTPPPKELLIAPDPEADPAARTVHASWLGTPLTPPKPAPTEPR